MNFREFINAICLRASQDCRRDCAISEIMRMEVEHPIARQIVDDVDKIGALLDVVAGLRRGYQHYQQSVCYGARLAFPAFELTLVEREGLKNRRVRERWDEFGGQTYRRRRIATKNDPAWSLISFFGFPFPPFDVSCGYGVEDVDFDEAVRLGVIAEDYRELEDFKSPPDPEWSFADDGYMESVCRRIVEVIR